MILAERSEDARAALSRVITYSGLTLIAAAVVATLTLYPSDPALDWLDIFQEGIFLLGGLGALWAARRADSPRLITGALLLTGSLAVDLADEFILPATVPSQWIPTALSAAGLGIFAWGLAELAARERDSRRRLQSSEDQVARYRAQLEVATMKDEFIATMSHELRTPLTAIMGAGDTLGASVAGSLTATQAELIGTISDSAGHLLAIINDILELSRLDAGRASITPESVDIIAVCRDAWALIAGRANDKKLVVQFSFPESPKQLVTDGRRLKQMLLNLFDNAVKFTPDGGRVGLDVAANAAANMISFTVWDSGIGIDPADQQRLFQPFVQLDTGLNREYLGTGLGLALVRRTARALGGDASVESGRGQGSRFTITLPITPAA